MIARLLAGLVVAAGFASAQHKVTGQTGAENSTTPTAKDGDHTIHYVTVGKATNNFYVRTAQHTSQLILLTFHCSLIASMLKSATS